MTDLKPTIQDCEAASLYSQASTHPVDKYEYDAYIAGILSESKRAQVLVEALEYYKLADPMAESLIMGRWLNRAETALDEYKKSIGEAHEKV